VLHCAWLNCLRLGGDGKATIVGIMLLQLTDSQFFRVYLGRLYRSVNGVQLRDAEMRQAFVKHNHSWPQPVVGCLIGPFENTRYNGSTLYRKWFQGVEIHPISWYPQDKIEGYQDDGYIYLNIENNQDEAMGPTVPMMDVAMVRAIPEAVVTFSVQVKNRRLPSPSESPLGFLSGLFWSAGIATTSRDFDDLPTVTVHSFDVVSAFLTRLGRRLSVSRRG